MEKQFLELIESSRVYKRAITLLFDSLSIFFAFWMAVIVKKESFLPLFKASYWNILLLLVPLSLLCFIKLGLYRAVLRYVGASALSVILIGALASTVILIASSRLLGVSLSLSIPVIYSWLLILSVGGSRIVVRFMLSHFASVQKEKVIVYGAGDAGRQLCSSINAGSQFSVVAFIDDDHKKVGSSIHGIFIYDSESLDKILLKKKPSKILLAMPSISRAKKQEIICKLEPLPLEILTVPSMEQVLAGHATFEEIKEVEIEDLLGRDSVEPRPELLQANISGKVVMITGAGGSIGSELCRQIIRQKPVKLILFEISEFALYSIEKELLEFSHSNDLNVSIIPVIGSIQDKPTLLRVFQSFRVQTLYHAAAYKHVPLVEQNVLSAIKNNVFGTYNTAQAAIESGVESFVLISTDKAVRPTNVMGTTKRIAELVLQALADGFKDSSHATRFCMVRFGNVLGSSGSVVPLFRKQIKQNGPITLTHPEITRYFMTIPEAAQLVIQAGAMGTGGDVFVLDMGESVKIKDLAVKMVHLSGLTVKNDSNPEGDIEIKCTGLRPGEKLYEELLIGENIAKTSHPRIMSAHEIKMSLAEIELLLSNINRAIDNVDLEQIREILLNAPTAFQPTDGIGDLVWHASKQTSNVLNFEQKLAGSR